MDPHALARTIADAYARRTHIPTPSSGDARFDLAAAYATEAALVSLRRAGGRRTVGLKVGFANKALWRALKLDTLVWAHMYDDTVRFATRGAESLSTASMLAPKIEPEIVFKISEGVDRRPGRAALPPADALASVEWLAVGFEIIDCVYPDWKFQPADFVAAFGLHAALIVGEPHEVEAAAIPRARGAAVAIHRPALAEWRDRGRRVGQKLAAQPCALPRGTAGGVSASGWCNTARRRRSGQLRHADRVASDRRRRHLACRARGDRLEAIDRGPRLKPGSQELILRAFVAH